MSDDSAKARKKEAKAAAKVEKARAKASAAGAGSASVQAGVGVTVRKLGESSELVVAGLKDEQIGRLLPAIQKEVAIALTEEKSPFRAGLLRFVKEGVFQTIVKVVAGLVVGYLLIRFGIG
jgi:hypothetical protein